MDGGRGADTYVFLSGDGIDLVGDFAGATFGFYSERPVEVGRVDNSDGGQSQDTIILPAEAHVENLTLSWGEALVTGDYFEDIKQGLEWMGVRVRGQTLFATLDISWGTEQKIRVIMPHSDDTPSDGIELFGFDDGSFLTLAELLARAPVTPDFDSHQADNALSGVYGTTANPVFGAGGDDVISGGGILDGGDGNDSVTGSDDADRLSGGRGADFLSGGMGADVLSGGHGADILEGDDGDDLLAPDSVDFWNEGNVYRAGRGNDYILGTKNEDIYYFDLGDGRDEISDYYHDDRFADYGGGYGAGYGGGYGGYVSPAQPGNHYSGDFSELVYQDLYEASRSSYYGGPAYLAWANIPAGTTLGGEPGGPSYNDKDILRFGVGIRPEDVAVDRYGYDLYLALTNGQDQIKFKNWFRNTERPLKRVEFQDGQAWDAETLEAGVGLIPNTAPSLLTPISDMTVSEDSFFEFHVPAGTFTDAESPEGLQYRAMLANGTQLPEWLSFDEDILTFSGTPDNDAVGTYSIRIIADDGQLSAGDVFDLRVENVNDAPEAVQSVPDPSVLENQPFIYTLPADVFVDVDVGDTVSLSASLDNGEPLPDWIVFDAASGAFSGTPPIGALGPLSIRVTARDASNGEGYLNFVLSVATAPPQTLVGTAGSDTLTGLSGNDFLDGLAGADSMAGGRGDDTYRVDNLWDQVLESPGEGVDQVESTVTYALPDNVENLALQGSSPLNGYGNALDNHLAGNSAANILVGAAGDDTLNGMGGNDELYGDEGDDTIFGGAGNDFLYGWIGNDRLEGEGGADQLFGDEGDDLIFAGDGGDILYGWTGRDYLNGGAGSDILDGGDGNDVLHDSADSNLLMGKAGNDTLIGGASADLLTGGTGSDVLISGTGADLILFNRGDGVDSVVAGAGLDNTVSLGGGIRYADLVFSKSNGDLVLNTGAAESITFKNWYSVASSQSVLTLQVIAEAMSEFDASSPDPLLDNKVETFDFAGLVGAFDAARTADPGLGLSGWALSNALVQFHLSGSDTEALGGDVAYQYGKNGSLNELSITAVQDTISSPQFGGQAQLLHSLQSLQEGVTRLS